MKYLVNSTDVYRLNSVEEVQAFHEELKNDAHFELVSFGYKHKEVKSKGEVVDSYELVTVKKKFNDEKEPLDDVEISYEVE